MKVYVLYLLIAYHPRHAVSTDCLFIFLLQVNNTILSFSLSLVGGLAYSGDALVDLATPSGIKG